MTTLFPSPRLCLLLCFSVSLVNSAPVPNGGDDGEYITLVEKAASVLPESDLDEDTLLHQEILQDHTIYRYNRIEKHGTPLFIRRGSDEGKPIIVLRQGEDFLPSCNNNRKSTFVVLKQSPTSKAQYYVFYAYVRPARTPEPSFMVEWDAWTPRGAAHNKALQFGFICCSKSNMVPCKAVSEVEANDSPDYEDFSPPTLLPGHAHHRNDSEILPPLPYVHPPMRVVPNSGSDYWCDIGQGTETDKRFVASVLGSLTQAMAVLSGAITAYKNEDAVVRELHKEIKEASATAPVGSGNGTIASKNPEAAAIELVNFGRSTVAGGTMMFYSGVVKLGALALDEKPVTERQDLTEDQLKAMTLSYNAIGMNVLRSLFRGAKAANSPEQLGATPNPHGLLNEAMTDNLIAGRSVGEAMNMTAQTGRGLISWIAETSGLASLFPGGPQTGLTNDAVYSGIQKDGTMSGFKSIDNLAHGLGNVADAVTGVTQKTAGQLFVENLHSGAYVPNGMIENAGDFVTNTVFGKGKISNDRGYVDDILDQTWEGVVGGTAAQIIDIGGNVLGPIGLGGVWNSIAGVTGLGLGVAAGVVWSPVGAVHNAVKVGAKLVGVEGVLGMHGSQSHPTGCGDQGYRRDWAKELKGGGGPLPGGNGCRPSPGDHWGSPDGSVGFGAGAGVGVGVGGSARVTVNLGPISVSVGGGAGAGAGAGAGVSVGGKRRKREAALDDNTHLEVKATTDVDLFSHLGWRTMDYAQDDLANASFAQEAAYPFIGFGNCVLKPASLSDFDGAQDGKGAARLYFQTMRTNCLKDQVETFEDLLTEGYVTYNPADKTFDLPENHPIRLKLKLSPSEISGLSKSLEMSVYSKLYMRMAREAPSPLVEGQGSRYASTLKSLALLYLDEAYNRAQLHYTKLVRNVGKLVKTAFIKSLQDFFRYKFCAKCSPKDVKDSLDNTVLLAGLLDFVVKEQENPAYNGMTKEAAFAKYWDNARREITSKKLLIYFV